MELRDEGMICTSRCLRVLGGPLLLNRALIYQYFLRVLRGRTLFSAPFISYSAIRIFTPSESAVPRLTSFARDGE